jgi:glucokinase
VRDRRVLACDIGGSITRVGVASDDCRVRHVHRIRTPASPSQLVREMTKLSAAAADAAGWAPSSLDSIGVAVPASVDPRDDSIGLCENLPELPRFPFRQAVSEAFGIPVALENDANAAALGELHHGSAQGERDFVLVIIGTGVGLGLVTEGKLLRGATGAAGEIGYLPFDANVVDPESGRPAVLYRAISGPAISRLADSMRAAHPDTGLAPGTDASGIFSAAEAGDALARAVLEHTTDHLCRALRVVTALLDPSVVLFGGGVGRNPTLVTSVSHHMTRCFTDPPALRTVGLGDDAGLVGAAASALAVADSDVPAVSRAAGMPDRPSGTSFGSNDE